jgi:probable aminopeptidase NPEPL1
MDLQYKRKIRRFLVFFLVILGTDTVQKVIIGAITNHCSRHNSPARSDQVINLINKVCPKKGVLQIVFLLDNPEFAFAYGCAVARCFPLYSRKSVKGVDQSVKKANKETNKVFVSFCIQPSVFDRTADEVDLVHSEEPNEIDLTKVSIAADSVRLAAKLVDMPTSELNTTVFVRKVKKQVDKLPGVRMTVFKGEVRCKL